MVAVGLSLGFLGAGGSAITLPVLVYVLNIEPRQAIAMSLAIVGTTSLVGALVSLRRKHLDWQMGLLFGLEGVVGAYFSSQLSYLVSPEALLMAYAALLIAIGTLMLLGPQPGDRHAPGRQLWKCSLVGGIVGILTGFFGVGGGFLIVPALIWFGGVNVRHAVGTSLMITTINSVAGLMGHAGRSRQDFGLTALLVVCAVAGVLPGIRLSRRVSPKTLRRGFAVFLLVLAMVLIVENYQRLAAG